MNPFFLIQISLTTFGFFYVDACKLIKMNSNFQIFGEGFHRRMQFSTNLSSIYRLINCQIFYHYQIPAGAFLDADELNRQFDPVKSHHPHCVTVNSFDVEKPHGISKNLQLSPALFHSNKISSKSFIINDQIEFPIHLRYHSPSNKFAVIHFEAPRVFLRCEQNETFLNEIDCKQKIEKVPCLCKQLKSKCSAFKLQPEEELNHLTVQIPIGNEDIGTLIASTTFIVVFLCSFLLLKITLQFQ